MGRSSRKRRPLTARVLLATLLAVLLLGVVCILLVPGFGAGVAEWFYTLGTEVAAAVEPPALPPSVVTDSSGTLAPLSICILDVGQGNCAFLRSPGGKTMLIDTGEYENKEALLAFLRAQGVERLDAVIATHPHSDHIGCMASVLRRYDVGAFYMPEIDHTSTAYIRMLETLAHKQVPITILWAGKNAVIPWDDDVTIRVLSPFETAIYPDYNENSLMLNVRYGETAMLFAADTGVYAEMLALANLPESYFRADVLQLGHHGSSSSTCPTFLRAVSPTLAVISCGANNDYGHPHREVLTLLRQYGVAVYRTDENGDVWISLDGNALRASPERESP